MISRPDLEPNKVRWLFIKSGHERDDIGALINLSLEQGLANARTHAEGREKGVSQPEVAKSQALSLLENGQRAVFLKSLVERAKNGEQQAFLALYQNHSRRIYSMSLRLAESLSEAENLTRDIFVEAFHNLDAIGDEEEFSTWLYRRAAVKLFTKNRTRRLAGYPR